MMLITDVTNSPVVHRTLVLVLMCGVFFCARSAKDDSSLLLDLCDRLKHANGARGPDSQDSRRVSVTGSDGLHTFVLDLFASELQLRGSQHIVQPHERDNNIFCWNGEIFDGLDIAQDENDGVKLFRVLSDASTVEEVYNLFGTIEGPYAFVYYNANSQRVFFARDPLGRRSLLIHKPNVRNPYFFLTSVSTGSDPACEFEELSTKYIYCLELRVLLNSGDTMSAFDSCTTRFPRNSSAGVLYSEPCRVNTVLPPDDWPLITGLESPDYLIQVVDELINQLDRSVELRVRDIPQARSAAARVAVLFSGGIDSTVLAFLAHKHIPLDEPIDLLNVAFENPRKINGQTPMNNTKARRKPQKPEANATPPYMVPDRVTGIQEVEELRKLCPRVWNFVEVNVPYGESQASHPLVESLMFPGRTVMDLSLALALYFASRGSGVVRDHPDSEPVAYNTPARVLLNGLGSDELLGGYGRHRTAYGTGGWKGVIDELQLEIDRIPSRNLGRDDRVISSHGKETRHPFLSLTFVSFVARLPVHFKMDPRVETGLGDKMLLRLAAKKMGLAEASSRKKRAMQFGSHSARMEGEKRGDVSIDLK
ncbi:asparagine synthase-domain-containing protein [Mycena maculata]|uniref:Asparagine synthase-domain-containing protein n=1 Tax=Mycena maculata TaxID=230809 RepID=A0AAD7KDS4_9AGAR|nr:asparagine synthase-domain-containing protein [Mycena maculata]